jgi:protein involved in polysaccharide export with SLBB domain
MQSVSRVCIFIAGLVTFGLILGCQSQQVALEQDSQPTAREVNPEEVLEYRIQPGDELDIKFFYNPELNEIIVVRPDGKISLQLLDDVHAAGLTPSQLEASLTRKYSKELRKPVVTVIVRTFAGQRVYVGGEVYRPGLVQLTAGMTALQAVLVAGGFMPTAKPDEVIVITKGPDNEPVPIRADLKKAIQAEDADVVLNSYDIVYVPKTRIAQANKFVNQYVEQLLLFRGTSLGFGFGYEVRRFD